MEQNVILYFQVFSTINTLVDDYFGDSEFLITPLNDTSEVFNFIGQKTTLLIMDVTEEGLTDDYIYLNNYLTCPKVFIFENSESLNESAELLSKYQIHGLVKSDTLNEKLSDILIKLDLIEGENDFLKIENIELNSEVSILVQLDSISDNNLTISKPGITGFSDFKSASIFLANFNYASQITQNDIEIDGENLKVTTDTTSLREQLKIFEYQNTPTISIAYISDEKPDYKLFNTLKIIIVHYEKPDLYSGEEDLILVKDKETMPKITLGAEICNNELASDKPLLIINRILPLSKYKHDNMMTTTDQIDMLMIQNFIKKNSIVKKDDVYFFDKQSNLCNGIIKVNSTIVSLNESFIKILLPFNLESTSKVKLIFLGNSHLTVIKSEASQGGYIVELHVDSFTENELNLLRRTINKLFYLDTKSIDISQFEHLNQIEEYELKDNEE